MLLLIDANYLCHRAWHAMPGLSYRGLGTSVPFGVLRDVLKLHDLFGATKLAVVFAFDSHTQKLRRCGIYKDYKGNRPAPATPEEAEAKKEFSRQLDRLRYQYLPALGYSNIAQAEGFEGDDLIAKCVVDYRERTSRIVIVSSDADLFQLLSPSVSIYNPHQDRMRTIASFTKDWGVKPEQWPLVKAIAGCKSDNIKGVPGVAEKTACKYLLGALGQKTDTYKRIQAAQRQIYGNKRLTKLPFPGCPAVKVEAGGDWRQRSRWMEIADLLGAPTLLAAARSLTG